MGGIRRLPLGSAKLRALLLTAQELTHCLQYE